LPVFNNDLITVIAYGQTIRFRSATLGHNMPSVAGLRGDYLRVFRFAAVVTQTRAIVGNSEALITTGPREWIPRYRCSDWTLHVGGASVASLS